MTRDDIIRMAREAECEETWGADAFRFNEQELERFAALIAAEIGIEQHRRGYESGQREGAAAERGRVAAWMIQRSYATGHGDTTEDLLKELEWQVRESEREAASERAWKALISKGADWSVRQMVSDAIRARGQE